MDDPKNNEEIFHQFMIKYPSLIPVWRPLLNTVYSKFALGSQHVADFAFCRDDSPGLRWHFIEIERPLDRLFTKNGDPSARLSHAIRQCLDWHSWFEENRSYVRNHFPHSDKIERFGLAEPHITLIIGRRQHIDPSNQPLMRAIGGKVFIRTFDSLKASLQTAWLDDKKSPLRCCALRADGEKELSRMKMNISFFVSNDTNCS